MASSARIGFSVPLALFMSGCAGLMHEVVWARLLATFVGNTAHAQAVVLTVFMGGLALGSALCGRIADRSSRPLRVYFFLEVLTGVYALVLPFLLRGAGGIYEVLAARVFESTGLTLALRFGLAVLIVLPPAVLMGGTLPVLAKHAIIRLAETQRSVGLLYALNNLGAAAGAAIAGFVTLAALGILSSLAIASVLNLTAGLLALAAERRQAAVPRGMTEPPPLPGSTPPEPLPRGAAAGAMLALLLSGFAAMGHEVVFLRVIALAFGSSTYSFTAMLVVFIAGIGIGSHIAARLSVRRPLLLFGLSQLGAAVALLAITPLLARLPYLLLLLRTNLQETTYGFELYLLGKVGLCFLFLLVPTACIGFGFPLVTQIKAKELRKVGSEVGVTYAWNTVGNVLGVLVTSLVLLPGIGMLAALHVNLVLQLVAGGSALVLSGTRPLRFAPLAAAAGAFVFYLAAGTGWAENLTLVVNHLRLRSGPEADADEFTKANHPTASFAAWRKAFVLDKEDYPVFRLEEDAHATVVASGAEESLYLYVNGKTDASTDFDLASQILVAQVPMMMARDPHSLLVIGHGSGITAGSASLHPLERIDLVEISRAVLDVDSVFKEMNHGVLANPRVHVYVDDARSFLRASPRSYDVIISEPTNPWIAGVANLFTQEFFREAAAKLSPGGVFCFWFHEYDQNTETVSLVLRTLGSVFPEVTVFRAYGSSDVIALASASPIEIDFDRMEDRFDRAPIRDEMARIELLDLTSFLAHHAISPEGFRALLGPGPLNTDLRQRLEFEAPRAFFTGEWSTLISSNDILERSGMGQTDSLLDRYLEHRAAKGEPVSVTELESAAHHLRRSGPSAGVIRALTLRAELAKVRESTSSRPARGGTLAAEQLGSHEAYARAVLLYSSGKIAAAIEMYRRALALAPGKGLAILNLSLALKESGRPDAAIALLEAAIPQHPFDYRMKSALGLALEKKGDLARARQIYSEVIARCEHPESLTNLANLVAADGKSAEAVALYERALLASDDYWYATYGLAKVLGRDPATRDRALSVLERALRRAPGNQSLRQLQQEIASAR